MQGLVGGVLGQDGGVQRPGHAFVQNAALLFQRHAGGHDGRFRRGRGGRRILGAALSEACALYAFVIAFMLLGK